MIRFKKKLRRLPIHRPPLIRKVLTMLRPYLTLCLGMLTTLEALPTDQPPDCKGKEIQDVAPSSLKMRVRHIEPQGVGYDQGYTSFDLFIGMRNAPDFLLPFLDLRAHVFDNGRPAVNAGLGFRFLTSSWVFGANCYYDYRKTKHYHYNQLGLGFEALGSVFDVRLNGYLPLGTKKSPYFGPYESSHFEGNYLMAKRKFEFAMSGLNAEVGRYLRREKNGAVYAAVGPYYFYNQGENAGGGAARLSATFYDTLKCEANASYDPVFKWIGQGQISLIFSFGPREKREQKKNGCARIPILWDRTTEPVERNEIIVLDKKKGETPVINPATGAPYFFLFVNNTSSSAGTFESPFPTMAEAFSAASPYDIIYVYPGSGASYATGTTGLNLQNYQKLWSSSITQSLETDAGTVSIAATTTVRPTLTGASAVGVGLLNLANGNEVSGFFLDGGGTAYHAILGGADGAPIESAILRNNKTIGAFHADHAPLLSIYGKGNLSINNNVFFGTDEPCILIETSGSDTLQATITSNRCKTYADNVNAISLESKNSSHFTVDLTANTILEKGDTNAPGLYIQSTSSSVMEVTASSNTISTEGDGSEGLAAYPQNSSTMTLSIESNTV